MVGEPTEEEEIDVLRLDDELENTGELFLLPLAIVEYQDTQLDCTLRRRRFRRALFVFL